MNDEHYRKLERMYHGAPINRLLGPKLSVSAGTASVVIAVRRDFFHAGGSVHGSLYFKALDDAAFFSVSSLVPDVFVLTASFNVQLLRPISEGELCATGRVVRPGRQLFFAESSLTDAVGVELGRGSGVFARSRVALGPGIGYA
jgi:uncharacterized protein (TIGR00369 family)